MSTFEIRNSLRKKRIPHKANDTIHPVVDSIRRRAIQDEVEGAIGILLNSLCINTQADHNTRDTPRRVAKMLVCEIFRGRFEPPPEITTFPNVKNLDEMMVTGPITVRSCCSHHLCPILGECWIGVVPGKRLAGLSKFNRIVDWFAARPQIQEELVVQIADFIEERLAPKGLAISMRASHTCMTWRGVREHPSAIMTINVMRGVFRNKPEARAEFLASIAQR